MVTGAAAVSRFVPCRRVVILVLPRQKLKKSSVLTIKGGKTENDFLEDD